MSTSELTLHFADPATVNVSFDGTDAGQLPFANPLQPKDRADLRWYIETYAASSLADPDDREAKRIEARLPELGRALFEAVFGTMAAYQLYIQFRQTAAEPHVITINSQDATILALPWELLYDPTGVYLFRERPRISIRRKITGATGAGQPSACAPSPNYTCSLSSAGRRAPAFLTRAPMGRPCSTRLRSLPPAASPGNFCARPPSTRWWRVLMTKVSRRSTSCILTATASFANSGQKMWPRSRRSTARRC